MFVCSRHNAHLPYRTRHCVSSCQLTGKIADCSFFLTLLFCSGIPKCSSEARWTIVAKWKELFQQTAAQAAGILPSDKAGFLNTADSPSEDLFLVCFILKFLPPRCTLSFFQLPNNNNVGGIWRIRSQSRTKEQPPAMLTFSSPPLFTAPLLGEE